MSGWIKIHRRLLDWEWFDDHNTFRLFTYILLKANYEPKKWHGISINRGQLLTSLPSLSDATGISVQSIRTSLAKLKSTGELTDKSTNKNRLLTIVNYDEYQSNDNELTGTSADNLTGQQQTTNRQLTATKEVKKEKKERNKELYRPDNVSDQTWEDFEALRKRKRSPITETAMKLIAKQADLANYTMEETLQECCSRGWASFKAEWVNKGEQNGRQFNDNKPSVHDNVTAGIALALAELD